jgi:hypothetical protein
VQTTRDRARHRAERSARESGPLCSRPLLWTGWAASRAFLLLALAGIIPLTKVAVLSDVSQIYHGWYDVFRAGHYPVGDVTWQYPPLTALVIVAPGLLPLGYAHAFILLAVACDMLALGLLIRADRRRGRRLVASWYWVLGIALLGPTVFARYDIMVTVVAIAALLVIARRPVLGGALAGIGVLLKVWPGLLLLGAPRGRRGLRAWLSTGGTVALLSLAAEAALPGAFSFLNEQQQRGIEIESLGGTVFQIARLFGWPGTVSYHYGSMEFLGPWVSQVATASLVLSAVAGLWLLVWRLRARHFAPAATADAALTATLLFVTTSRVISPQYLIWLIGLAAVCLCVRGTTQRPVALLLLPVAALTVLEFPLGFDSVVGGRPLGVCVLAARNVLLLAATLLACARLWRSTSLVPLEAEPEEAAGPRLRPDVPDPRSARATPSADGTSTEPTATAAGTPTTMYQPPCGARKVVAAGQAA